LIMIIAVSTAAVAAAAVVWLGLGKEAFVDHLRKKQNSNSSRMDRGLFQIGIVPCYAKGISLSTGLIMVLQSH
jgi:hypothetical protein